MQHNNILWITGAQATGKTTMYEFFKNTYSPVLKIFDEVSEGNNIEAFSYIDSVLNGFCGSCRIVIFSQSMPPQLVNNKVFDPIIIKLDSVEKEVNNPLQIPMSSIDNFFNAHFEHDSDSLLEFDEIREHIDRLNPLLTCHDITKYLNDNYNHYTELIEGRLMVFYEIKII